MSEFWTSQPIEAIPMPAVGERGNFVLRVWRDGIVNVIKRSGYRYDEDESWRWPNIHRLNEFIGVLQEVEAFGKEHFGEDWGK